MTTTDIVTVSPDDSVEELAEPTDRGYTHLPVVTADSKLVGIVSTTTDHDVRLGAAVTLPAAVSESLERQFPAD